MARTALAPRRRAQEDAPRMFLVLERDRCVHAYASPDEAAATIEALEVEGKVWTAYDDEARPYRIEWLKPNRLGKTVGFLTSAVNGEYRFVVAGAAEPVALLEMLREAPVVLPESERERVRALADLLSNVDEEKSP